MADVCLPSGVCVSSWPWFPVPRALLRSARPRTNPAFTPCLSLSEVPGARGRAEPLFILLLKPLLPPSAPLIACGSFAVVQMTFEASSQVWGRKEGAEDVAVGSGAGQ